MGALGKDPVDAGAEGRRPLRTGLERRQNFQNPAAHQRRSLLAFPAPTLPSLLRAVQQPSVNESQSQVMSSTELALQDTEQDEEWMGGGMKSNQHNLT